MDMVSTENKILALQYFSTFKNFARSVSFSFNLYLLNSRYKIRSVNAA